MRLSCSDSFQATFSGGEMRLKSLPSKHLDLYNCSTCASVGKVKTLSRVTRKRKFIFAGLVGTDVVDPSCPVLSRLVMFFFAFEIENTFMRLSVRGTGAIVECESELGWRVL